MIKLARFSVRVAVAVSCVVHAYNPSITYLVFVAIGVVGGALATLGAQAYMRDNR